MPETQSTFLTIKFKLHNPSQRRRAVLLDAMRQAHLGYDEILQRVRPDVEAIAGIEERNKAVADVDVRLCRDLFGKTVAGTT